MGSKSNVIGKAPNGATIVSTSADVLSKDLVVVKTERGFILARPSEVKTD